ncbi:MAG: glycosyltransferase family protein [Bacteroidota bacterium]
MRIFMVLHPSGNMRAPGNTTWLKNLYEPLVDLGHDVFLFRLDEFLTRSGTKFRSPEYRETLSETLVDTFYKEHHKKKFHLFFSYLTVLDVFPGVVNKIASSGVCTVNFSCNNTHQFHLVEGIANEFQYNAHAEKKAGAKFTKAGATPVWFQMAVNPTYYYPRKSTKKYDVSFVGMNYAKRAFYLNHILENGLDANVFGPGWVLKGNALLRKEIKRYLQSIKTLLSTNKIKRNNYSAWVNNYDFSRAMVTRFAKHFHAPVTDQEVYNIYSQTKINLGFLEVYSKDNHSHSVTDYHIHLREFEVPMSGELYCTNYSEELSEFYEPDKEVIIFRNEHELLDKIKFYLKHTTEAEKIRTAGYARSMNEHTSQKRFAKLFETIKL